MKELVISIRRAKPDDAPTLSAVFDAAWREADLVQQLLGAHQRLLGGGRGERLLPQLRPTGRYGPERPRPQAPHTAGRARSSAMSSRW